MAKLVWTEPALRDLDEIADYIALDDPQAARRLAQRIFSHVDQLQQQPESGSRIAELGTAQKRFRQIVEPPCRILYRFSASEETVFILYVMRGEMLLRNGRLWQRDRDVRTD